MAQPPGHRLTLRSDSLVSLDTLVPAVDTKLHPACQLPPTIPSPFTGTLETSLDAILEFTSLYPDLQRLTTRLLQDVDHSTNWMELCKAVINVHEDQPARGRHLLEELFFLVTRTLLPEQIVENRKLMYRMYFNKRSLSARVILRYDMLRDTNKRPHAHHASVESRLPSSYPLTLPPPQPLFNSTRPYRCPLMPNIIPTLIVADPATPYYTSKLGQCMRHHITELDRYLLLTDETVEEWGTVRLLMAVCEVVCQWQWVRENSERLEDMDCGMWEGIEGKADECEWVRDTKNFKVVI